MWSWKTRVHDRSLPIANLDRVVWKGRRVVVVFDSDLAEKPAVAWAEHALVQELRRRGAEVYLIRLPTSPCGEKSGFDDYLVASGPDAFKQLPMQTPVEADQGAPTILRMSDLVDAYLLQVGQPHHRVTLGYSELDFVRGVAPGEVMTILGRAGVGKTAFGLNLIDRMTAAGQLPSLIFSLEQPGLELFERMASITTGLEGREIEERARNEDPQLVERLVEVCRRWEHVAVVEMPCTLERIDQLIAEARSGDYWSEPLRLVLVDYVGLIGARRPTSSYEHVSQTARELKNLAKRHRVGLVALCQVDRAGESGGVPITQEMARDSGVIEEAADYLLGIWRPELAKELPKEKRRELRGQFKVRVIKNRGGPAPRTVTLHFEPTTLRISAAKLGLAVEPVDEA